MKRTIRLGRWMGVKVMARPSAVLGSILLWVVFGSIGVWLLDLPVWEAIVGGIAAVILHWFSELWHQLSHAWAARRTGHPMSGLMLVGILGTSLYPRDEGTLPARVHIRRALGGPAGSLVLAVVAGLIALALHSRGGVAWWVALFFFLDNLLVFTLGAFLPLGFTDGSTLLEWWGKRE